MHTHVDRPTALLINSSGGYYLAGTASPKSWLSKHDTSGEQIWSRDLSGSIYAVALAPSGNLYVAGTYVGETTWDSITVKASPPDIRGSSTDAFVAELDTMGHALRVVPMLGNKGDEVIGVACDRTGYLYLSGSFGDDWVGADNIRLGDTLLFGNADRSVFTAKLDPHGTPSSSVAETIQGSHALTLDPIFPNPVSDHAVAGFTLPRSMNVRLALFDSRGEELRSLLDATVDAGSHRLSFDLRGYATGLYHLRLAAGERMVAQRVIVVH